MTWLPGYTRVDLPLAGGAFAETKHPKLEWHTTEGRSVAAAGAAYRPYPPHLCVDPATGEKVQHIPLNRHAYANKSDRSDREYVIQVEVVGFAAQSHTWSEERLRWLGQHVVAPIRDAVGVPDVVVRGGFHGESEGIILASPTSPIRLTDASLRVFSGHLAHQHMPAPDAHWDAGRLPIDRILTYSQEAAVPFDTAQIADLNARSWSWRDNQNRNAGDFRNWFYGEWASHEANMASHTTALAQLLALHGSGNAADMDVIKAEIRAAAKETGDRTAAAAREGAQAAVSEAMRAQLAEIQRLFDEDNAAEARAALVAMRDLLPDA